MQYFAVMATKLQWQGVRLHLLLTSYYMYPHKICFDSNGKNLKVIKNHLQLIPYYFVSIGLSFILGVPCLLVPILKYIFLSNKPSGITVSFMVIWLAFGLTAISTNFIVISYSDSIATYMNSFVNYKKLLHTSIIPSKRYHSKLNDQPYSIIRHIQEINLELLKILQRQESVDYLGIFISNFAVYSTFLAMLLSPIGFYLKLDPFAPLIKDIMPLIPSEYRSTTLKTSLSVLNLIVDYLIVMEGCRTNTLLIMLYLLHQSVILKCMKLIKIPRVSPMILRKYTQLQILVQVGQWITQIFVGTSVTSVYFITLFLTCFTAIGWKMFSWKVYVFIVPATPIAYFLIAVVFNYTVSIENISRHLIHHEWPNQAMTMFQTGDSNWFSVRRFKKMLRVHRPLIFHCGKLFVMDQATKTNYYNYIFLYTANTLLLFNMYYTI